jgi:hypothetical protein
MPSADDVLSDSQDAFDNFVSDRTNVLDLASHYPYSPERWRLFVDGSRVFPEYADPVVNGLPQYTHGRMDGANGAPKDVHTISPNAGETVVLETAERPRYVVQFELTATMAAQLNQEPVGDDRLRMGLYDGSDGWYFEQTATHATDECDLVSLRTGSEIYRDGPLDARVASTAFARLALTTGWYNITRQEWERSYSENGRQRNILIGGPGQSSDDARGPETGNLPIRLEITADSGTSDLELLAGSAAQVNLGTTVPISREKTAEFTANIGTTDTWVPLYAIRVDPNRQIVNTQLVDTDVVEFSADADVRVMPIAASPSNVADGTGSALTDGDFSTPAEHTAANSVVEATSAVGEFPDSTGAVVTSAGAPGGYQLGFASAHTSGTGSKTQVESGAGTQKRGIRRDDYCVFLGYADATGDVSVEYITEQDW